ncbi:LLM class flavin-dependent oxidoreductase [Xylanimonas allomyrinae]|uniref:LLM class flavin-dependent oxidoreductase n=1 Tax=Xylanimonas allomyrinae TaxID=2509459 RepID=A0A4P6ELR3_9MICO|nr:LLM class flavin-dependent oxidoreductase [Xylanimonas allomyrinae]QAY63750.1 LLM class flavin-dependent oxidoreductase [Xylanimonas allomyrinae]
MTIPFFVGLDVDGAGAHPAAATASGQAPADLLSGARLARSVRQAENAGVTFVTFTDALLPAVTGHASSGRLDAVTRAAFVARTTTAIGLVPQVPTTYPEPFHVAAQLASLDHAAAGRGGWLAGVTRTPETAAAYGRAAVDDVEREARDVVQVVRDLWDTWEDDAVIRDVATGRYVDRDRIHYPRFEGASFSVTGPLITPRPPQGQLVVLAAAGDVAPGSREPLVDVALVGGTGAADATAAALESRARPAGSALGTAGPDTSQRGTAQASDARAVDGRAPRAGVEVEVVLDADGRRAADRLRDLDAATPGGVRSPWGAPAPSGTSPLRYVGDGAGLVALLTSLAASGVDGVRLLPAVLDTDLRALVREVLPALRAARVVVPPRPGATLRETLGLPRPANRYARVA